MAIQFEAYTAEGILRGTVGPTGRLGDLLAASASIAVEAAIATPLDGRPPTTRGRTELAVDDLLIVVAPADTPAPVHASWHDLALVAGPYAVEGLLPTLPGFDPGRALARPSGTFVLVASARVSLAGEPSAGSVEHRFAWVNRYTVERVEADIELGIFFPGAASELLGRGGRPDSAERGPAPATAPTPAASPASTI
jgi:hypothetical protein